MAKGNMLKKIWNQYRIWKPWTATKNILYQWENRERRKNFGPQNDTRTLYIIRSLNEQSLFYTGPIHNLLANYFYVLSHLQYAKQNGWVPIIDQLHYPVYNSLPQEINGTRNAWEYFWQQPSCVSLAEAYQSRHVILSKRSWFWEWDLGYDKQNYQNSQKIKEFHCFSQEVPLNAKTLRHIEKVQKELLPEGKKTLGVSYRFDYSKYCKQPGPGHPIQPEVEELIEMVRNRIKAWGIQRVFLASDEGEVVRVFQSMLGKQLVILPRQRMEKSAQYTPQNPNPMYLPESIFATTQDYLTEMELLSRCNALMGSVTSGLRYAIVRNGGKYEQMDILERGRFPDQRKKG